MTKTKEKHTPKSPLLASLGEAAYNELTMMQHNLKSEIIKSTEKKTEKTISKSEETTKEILLSFKEEFREFKKDINKRFEQIEKRFEQIDKRFEQIDKRFEQIERKFEQIELKLENQANRQFEFEGRIISLFKWSIGLTISMSTFILSALAIITVKIYLG